MACRSFEGAALTVSLSEFLLPPGGGVRDNVAEGVGLEGLPLRRVLVLEYGLEDLRAAEVGGARVERRVGGMARVKMYVLFWLDGVGGMEGHGVVCWRGSSRGRELP